MKNHLNELSMEELEMVDGGFNWGRLVGGGYIGGLLGMAGAGIMLCAMATPAGWAAAAAGAGIAAAGAATGVGVGAITSAIMDD